MIDRKESKIGIILLGILIGGSLISCFSINFTEIRKRDREADKHYVALICKSTESSFFKAVFAGANAASTEYNLVVSYEGPANEEDEKTQNEMIRQAVENNAEVIVLSAVDYNANVAAVEEAAQKGTKIIIIDSDVNSQVVACHIGTDNYKAGEMAAEAIVSSKEEILNIGIINFDKNSANGSQREQGFRDKLLEYESAHIVETVYVNSNIEDAKLGTKALLEAHPEINAVVTFNEWTSLGVGYAILELGLKDEVAVVAFDNHVVLVGMLESGEIDALIVQNPYAMGYLGVEYAYKYLYGLSVGKEKIDTETLLVTKKNMYDEACQRILFPFN